MKVTIMEIYPWISWKMFVEPLGSGEHTLGTSPK